MDFDPEFHGTKTITLSVDDEISADSINHHETGVASKTVTMKVTNINDSPEITAIDKLITTEKVEKIFQIHFTDKDNNSPLNAGSSGIDTHKVKVTSSDERLEVVRADGSNDNTTAASGVSYKIIPAADPPFAGTGSLTVSVEDSSGVTESATSTITVDFEVKQVK